MEFYAALNILDVRLAHFLIGLWVRLFPNVSYVCAVLIYNTRSQMSQMISTKNNLINLDMN